MARRMVESVVQMSFSLIGPKTDLSSWKLRVYKLSFLEWGISILNTNIFKQISPGLLDIVFGFKHIYLFLLVAHSLDQLNKSLLYQTF